MYCNVVDGCPGPVSRKLASYGNIWGLAFGAYGEASPAVHDFVQVLATEHASRHWIRIGGRDPQEAVSMLARNLHRSWGLTVVRGQAHLKLAGLSHVGAGSAGAQFRRDRAAAVFSCCLEAYQLHFAAQHLHRRRL